MVVVAAWAMQVLARSLELAPRWAVFPGLSRHGCFLLFCRGCRDTVGFSCFPGTVETRLLSVVLSWGRMLLPRQPQRRTARSGCSLRLIVSLLQSRTMCNQHPFCLPCKGQKQHPSLTDMAHGQRQAARHSRQHSCWARPGKAPSSWRAEICVESFIMMIASAGAGQCTMVAALSTQLQLRAQTSWPATASSGPVRAERQTNEHLKLLQPAFISSVSCETTSSCSADTGKTQAGSAVSQQNDLP